MSGVVATSSGSAGDILKVELPETCQGDSVLFDVKGCWRPQRLPGPRVAEAMESGLVCRLWRVRGPSGRSALCGMLAVGEDAAPGRRSIEVSLDDRSWGGPAEKLVIGVTVVW